MVLVAREMMIPPADFTAFVVASLLLLVIPGPAVLYIATRSASQGRAAGMVSVAGIASGGLVHVIAAAAGVSALLARSAVTMQYLRYAGAAYLLYLGVQKIRAARNDVAATTAAVPRERLSKIYRDGLIVNLLNPKTALFFLAFLPQFVDPARGPVLTQLLVLGLVFVALAVVSDSAYALAAAAVAGALGRRPRFNRAAGCASGAVYIGLAAATASSS